MMDDIDAFLARHSDQLHSMGLPTNLHAIVAQKVLHDTFDAGLHFTFALRNCDNEEGSGDFDGDSHDDDAGDYTQGDAGDSNQIARSHDDDDQDAKIDPLGEEEIAIQSNHDTPYSLHAIDHIADGSDVFLIDHCWTTSFPKSREHLRSIPGLVSRVASMIKSTKGGIDGVWQSIWPYMNCYSLSEDDYTQWYLMDEVGTSIMHSSIPNVRCCPLLVQLQPLQPAFGISVMWPVRDIGVGESITRDYLPCLPIPHTGNPSPSPPTQLLLLRRLRLLSFISTHRQAVLRDKFQLIMNKHNIGDASLSADSSGNSSNRPVRSDVDPSALASSTGSADMSCQSTDTLTTSVPPPAWSVITKRLKDIRELTGGTLLVYCDRAAHLTDSMITNHRRIRVTDDPLSADVLYLIGRTIDGSDTSDEFIKSNKMTNQFWWEGMVVSKEHLCHTLKAADISSVSTWFPSTHDLSRPLELAEFINDATKTNPLGGASDDDDGDVWILKKHRGRQSIDYPVTRSLSCALRHLESSARIASKYVRSPLLHCGRKFDLRYYVCVHSLEPLVLYRHSLFNVRCANSEYMLDDLEMYQRHFTVMNLLDDEDPMSGIRGRGERSDPSMADLIQIFDDQHAPLRWHHDVQPKVDAVIRNVFRSVSKMLPSEPAHPSGQPLHPNACWSLNQPNAAPARAMYGLDIIIGHHEGTLRPYVLEVQFGPDCGQAMKYHSSFWDDILSNLYLNDDQQMVLIDNCTALLYCT